MLYQSYKEKLDKRRRMFDNVWRFRLLILSVFLLVLATIGAMLGIKGIVSGFTLPEICEYGSPIAAKASCVFGKPEFEYREVGESEWTTVAPVLVGEYECRPVGKTIVGSKRIGETKSFTIQPYETDVQVEGNTLMYGDQPQFDADLKYDDRLVVNNYTLSRENGKVNVSVDAADVLILNSDGKDVTDSYIINAEDKSLSDKKRPITVRTATSSFVYDGKTHSDGRAEIISDIGLVNGHSLEVTTADDYKDVGNYPNSVETMRILDGDGEDVTENYNISVSVGTLVISSRSITVGYTPDDIVYDGKEHVYDTYEILKGELAEGQELRYTPYVVAKDVSAYPNYCTVSIWENGRDVTRNYNITKDFAPLRIVPRVIKVTTPTESFTYDGSTHYFGEVDLAEGELAENQYISANGWGEISCTFVGEYDNTPQFNIMDENGYYVTQNYDITAEYGKITVLKRAVTAVTASAELWYDGYYHYFGADTVECTDGELAPNDELLFTQDHVQMLDANEEGYENAPQISVYNPYYGYVSDNYDLTVQYGTIKIKRRTLTVTSGTEEFEYDGTEQSCLEFKVEPTFDDGNGNGLAQSHSVNVLSATSRIGCCEPVTNEQEINIVDWSNNDVSENYIITKSYGTISITPRPVSFDTGSDSWTYDGESHSCEEIIPNNLANGHKISSYSVTSALPSLIQVGKTNNGFTFNNIKISDASGKDVTENYSIDNIAHEIGEIEVTKRQVTLKTGDNKETIYYDAQPHSEQSYSEISNKLVAGHKAVADYQSFVEAGVHENSIIGDWRIVDGSNENVTDNYEITWQSGVVNIEKRPIQVTTGSLPEPVIYDGQAHSAPTVDISEVSPYYPLVEGQSLVLEYETWTDVGEHPNKPKDNYKITDVGGNNYTNNYSIDWNYGKVTIEKRPIHIKTDDMSWIYDATAHNTKDQIHIEYYLNTPLEGHTVTYNVVPRIEADENEYQHECSDINITYNGASVLNNYDVISEYGTIKIDKRPLTVKTASFSWIYNGSSQNLAADTTFEYYEGRQLLNHVITLTYDPITEACDSVENNCRVSYIYDGTRMVTQNYDITYEKGSVVIYKRKIKLTTSSNVWIYEAGKRYFGSCTMEKTTYGSDRGLLSNHSFTYGTTMLTGITDSDTEVKFVTNEVTNRRIVDSNNEDKTNNYEFEVEYGKLRVKSPIEVRVSSVKKTYDGKPVVLTEKNFNITKRPPDVQLSDIHLEFDISHTDPFVLTLEDVKDKVECSVDGADPSDNRFDFYGQTNIIEISKRKITIQTASIVGLWNGETGLLGTDTPSNPYWISYGSLATGHELRANVTGYLAPDEDYASNTLMNVQILDEYGIDITTFYEISVNLGTLSWTYVTRPSDNETPIE